MMLNKYRTRELLTELITFRSRDYRDPLQRMRVCRCKDTKPSWLHVC